MHRDETKLLRLSSKAPKMHLTSFKNKKHMLWLPRNMFRTVLGYR